SEYPMDTIVSMNMWGLDTGVFDFLEKEFSVFLKDNINEPKKEFLLPTILNDRMNRENKKIKVLNTDSQWYGVTYREDSPGVSAAMQEFINKGLYDFK
ncbi:MAG: nucleotidyltransferase, partial [Monoglobaceae bacterium]